MKSGFVTIIGQPNVGKSTFLNKMVGQKIAITTPKAQTTRNNITGVYNDNDSQIVFIDTPGIHTPYHELGRIMNKNAISTLNAVDIILFMIEDFDFKNQNENIIEILKKANTPIILVINKIDLLKNKTDIDKIILKYKDKLPFKAIIPISTLNDININHLIDEIKNNLEEGPKYYPDNQITDNPLRFLIAELIREKIILLTKEEIPHSIAVVIEDLKDEENLLNIRAEIIVERPSQKQIIIGKNGSMIKEIGRQSRLDINNLLNVKSYLDLWVKVKKDWRNKKIDLQNFGYFDIKE